MGRDKDDELPPPPVELERIWNCGSPLYDAHELVSANYLIEKHLMVFLPGNTTATSSIGLSSGLLMNSKSLVGKSKRMIVTKVLAPIVESAGCSGRSMTANGSILVGMGNHKIKTVKRNRIKSGGGKKKKMKFISPLRSVSLLKCFSV